MTHKHRYIYISVCVYIYIHIHTHTYTDAHTYIHKTFHPKAAEYTFFSSTHGIFSNIDHMLGQKQVSIKFKKTEIISSIFSNHNAMRLEINYKGKKKPAKSNHKHMCTFTHTHTHIHTHTIGIFIQICFQ